MPEQRQENPEESETAEERLLQESFTMELSEEQTESIREATGKEIVWLTTTNVAGMEERIHEEQLAGGPEAVAHLLKALDIETADAILARMEEGGRRLAKQIRRTLFPFERIVRLEDGALQSALRTVDGHTLAAALLEADDEIRRKILSCIPSAKRVQVQEEISILERAKTGEEGEERTDRLRRDAEAAQDAILDLIRRFQQESPSDERA